MATPTAGWSKWLLVRYDAALKTKLDSMEAASAPPIVGGVDSETLGKSTINECIAPVALEKPRRITVKLPKNLAKDGAVLLSILKNYPEIEIADKSGAVTANGVKLGPIARVIKQIYAKSAKPSKNAVKIFKILHNGHPTRQQFKGAKNLRVWRKIQKFGG